LKKIATFCLKSEEGEVHVFVGDPYKTVYSYKSFNTISWEIENEITREMNEKYGPGFSDDIDTAFMGISDEHGIVQDDNGWGFTFFEGELLIIPFGDDQFRDDEVDDAATAARSARFEHGETPAARHGNQSKKGGSR
jgi:hypothetical protein